MKVKLKGLLTLFLALIVQISFAQEKTISGTVSDDSGALPGVSIIIKGTSTGTETDFDGKYSIKAKTGDVLIFSYVGYVTAERTVGTSNTINVDMVVDDNVLDEVVVTGYGTSTKQSFTGSAKTVRIENIEKKNVSNISQALAGEVAGVNVINGSGQPGNPSTIRIRGFGSVNGNRDPLYVLDGVPFDGVSSSINPADIESTTILKDATATAIYGARGANGVILITTKKGKIGESSIEVDIKTGINLSLIPRYDLINSVDEYIETAWEAIANSGDDLEEDPVAYANANLFSAKGINPKYNLWDVSDISELIDPVTGKIRSGVTRKYNPEKWEDHGFQQSIRNEANLRMSGGSEKTRYSSSFGYLNDVGYIINSDYKRYSTRLNITHKPKKWLTANANIGYSYGQQTTNGQSSDSGSIFWFIDNLPPIYPLYERDTEGKLIPDDIYGGNIFDYGIGRGFGALTNAIADATYNVDENKRHSINGNFSFNIKFSEDFSFESKYGIQYYSRVSNAIGNPFYGSGAPQKGSLFKTHRDAVTQNILNILRYNKTYGSHKITALVAHESNQWKEQRSTISKSKVVNLVSGLDDAGNYVNTLSPASGYKRETALESYFGQINYSLKDKYFVTGSVRQDGSSRFANDKWGTFGSAGLSWIISKESFMENIDFLDFLKVKISYGILGDQGSNSTDNQSQSYYSGQGGYDINVLDDEISLTVRAIQNPNLTWETSKILNTGLEFNLFNNLIDVSADYYIKNTDDLIFQRRTGPSVGDAILTVNDGVLKNSGFEFDITAHIFNKKNFSLDFTINGEILSNELTVMPIDPATGKQKVLDQQGLYGRSAGHSLFDYYTREWAGVDPEDGNAKWNIYYHDANSNGELDSEEEIKSLTEYQNKNPNNAISKTTTKTYEDATEKYVGKSAIPDVRGAFRLSAEFYGFDFSSQFAYSLGGYGYDSNYADKMEHDQVGSNSYHIDIRDRWKKPGDKTDVPRLYSDRHTKVSNGSTRFLTSSDYLALSNFKVGYTVPNKFIKRAGVSNVNIWFSGDNLFLLSARAGFNPATSENGRANRYRYSPLTTFSLGVRIKI